MRWPGVFSIKGHHWSFYSAFSHIFQVKCALYFYVCFTIASPFSMINFLFNNNLSFVLSRFQNNLFSFPLSMAETHLLWTPTPSDHYLLVSKFFLVTHRPKYLGALSPAGGYSINKNKALNDQGYNWAKKYCSHLYYMTSAVSWLNCNPALNQTLCVVCVIF